MSYARRLTVNITTAADGTATAFSDEIDFGLLHQIVYTKTNFVDGSTITVSGETTGQVLWQETGVNANAVRAPRQPTQNTTGGAALYAAGGTSVLDKIAVVAERLKITVSGAGAATTGRLDIIMA